MERTYLAAAQVPAGAIIGYHPLRAKRGKIWQCGVDAEWNKWAQQDVFSKLIFLAPVADGVTPRCSIVADRPVI